jgi:acetyl-CoA carboxylase biotin carboxyl carrier protein
LRRAGTAQEYVVPGPASAPVRIPAADASQILVKSPIVGTYYDAPAPGAATFIKVGDPVEPGQVLCIIESMKLMNEIEAEVAGVVAAKLVENGRPVEYGEALFSIRPR